MFTGIVEDCGDVVYVGGGADVQLLIIKTLKLAPKCNIGDSVSINGVCLTVTVIDKGELSFDVTTETLKHSNIGGLRSGMQVNLELAMSPNGRFGGHFVLGHADGIGSIKAIDRQGAFFIIKISVSDSIMRYIVHKGSVTIDGISLTVADIDTNGSFFSIAVIPHTMSVTTLGCKRIGESVNIEVDIIGKYVERFIAPFLSDNNKGARESESLLKKLTEEGFIR
ncbi:MAG: riboflavin synthase [Candidatus Magnetoovum sp. WYHC-5]|nr:riboflavin synthase [Candidatus Magnetoovum sp. WYHC-5]